MWKVDGKWMWIEWMWMWKVDSGAVPDLTYVGLGQKAKLLHTPRPHGAQSTLSLQN